MTVVPNSKSRSIALHDGTLKIHITKPPVEGRANKAIIEYLSKILRIKKSSITIDKGAVSKSKLIAIEDMEAGEFLKAIIELTG